MGEHVVAVVRETRHTTGEEQLQQVQEWAAEHGHIVLRVVTPDVDDLGRVCDDVQAETLGGAVVARLDVLGDVVHQEALHAVLTRSGGTLYVADVADAEHLASPDGLRQVLRDAMGTLQTLQARTQVARLTRGADRRREIAGRSGGRAPFGMRFIAGELVEDAREQSAKVRMKQLRDEGLGYSAIGRRLQAEGYVKRNGETDWHPDMVRRVLLRDDQAS